MVDASAFWPYLAAWFPVIGLLAWRQWKTPVFGTGLVLAYSFQLWLLYWLGALMHAFPWSELPDSDLSFLGFQQATLGIVAFAIGSFLAGRVFCRLRLSAPIAAKSDNQLPVFYLISGAISYSVLAPTLGRLPSLNALTAVGQQLVVVGLCLGCWKAWREGGNPKLVRWLPFGLLLPVITIIGQGFLGYGTIALSIVLIFVSHFVKPRWILIVASLAVGYMGLSFYTAYMRSRNEIRASVWGGEAVSTRIDRLKDTLFAVEPFNPHNQEHLQSVDDRVNQNMLVGAAVRSLSVTNSFARGETVWLAALGMIPRIVWPSKPATGGSGDLVSRFTGLTFAEGTSIGIGPVMELYANFGRTGVFCGFALIGLLVTGIDIIAALQLYVGNWPAFALWFLVGIAFLQVGGSFVEVTSSAVASVVLGRIVNSVFLRRQRL